MDTNEDGGAAHLHALLALASLQRPRRRERGVGKEKAG